MARFRWNARRIYLVVVLTLASALAGVWSEAVALAPETSGEESAALVFEGRALNAFWWRRSPSGQTRANVWGAERAFPAVPGTELPRPVLSVEGTAYSWNTNSASSIWASGFTSDGSILIDRKLRTASVGAALPAEYLTWNLQGGSQWVSQPVTAEIQLAMASKGGARRGPLLQRSLNPELGLITEWSASSARRVPNPTGVGGINLSFADGSVRFIAEDTATNWGSLVTTPRGMAEIEVFSGPP